MEKIFLLHAAAQSGKNTCAYAMKEYYEATYHKKVLILAFADYVKFVLDKYYNTPAERTEEYRTRIQQFATDQCREKNPYIWVNVIQSLLEVIKDDFDIFIIPDWRFKNEYTSMALCFSGNTKVIPVLINRPGIEQVDNMTEEQRSHDSERNLDNFKNFNYTIINETSQIQKTIHQLIDMIDEVEND